MQNDVGCFSGFGNLFNYFFTVVLPTLPPPEPEDWYVYFAQNAKGNIKIGHTRDLDRRLTDLTKSTSADHDMSAIELVALLEYDTGTEARKAELRFQKDHRKDCIKGEWFSPSVELLADIDAINRWQETGGLPTED